MILKKGRGEDLTAVHREGCRPRLRKRGRLSLVRSCPFGASMTSASGKLARLLVGDRAEPEPRFPGDGHFRFQRQGSPDLLAEAAQTDDSDLSSRVCSADDGKSSGSALVLARAADDGMVLE